MTDHLEIIYQDPYLVAVNKPAGLLVHRTDLAPNAVEFAVQILRKQIGQYVYPLHRLDKPTSGVLLFSLNLKMAQEISQTIQESLFHKEYLALVRGWPPENFEVNRGVKSDKESARKEALTRFERLSTVEIEYAVGPFNTARYSLIQAFPISGRRHQIRKHLNHVSYPIVGDTWYGDRDHNRFFLAQKLPQLMLHSHKLYFKHPVSQDSLHLEAPLPGHWIQALDFLGITYPG